MLPCPFVDKLDSMSFATRSFEWMQLPSSILFESRDGHKLSTQCYEMIGLCQTASEDFYFSRSQGHGS